MGGFSSREALLSDLFSQTCLLVNVEAGYLLERGVERSFLMAHKGIPDAQVHHLSNYGLPIQGNGQENAGEVPWQIPIRSSERPWGLVCFPGASPVEGRLEKSALVQTAWKMALDRLQWTLSARQQIEALTLANTLSQAAAEGLPLETCLGDVAKHFATMGGAQHAYLFAFDEKRGLLRGMAATHNRGDAVRDMEIALDTNALVALTAREKHPLMIEDAQADPRMDKKWLRLFNARAVLSLPLLLKERVVGVLLLDDTRHFKRFTPQEVETLVTLTAPVTTALDHAMRHREAMRRVDRLQSFSLSVVNLQEEEKKRMAQLLRQESDKRWLEMKRTIAQVEQGLVGGETAPEAPSPEVPRETAPSEDAPADAPAEVLKEVLKEVPKPSALQQESPTTPRTAPLRAQIRTLQTQAARAREEIQKIANDLRPATLDGAGLLPTLRGYLEVYSKRARITTSFQSPGMQKRLSPPMEIFLYRLVQEALTNVAKHAQAKSVLIGLEKKDLYVCLSVTDDGKGFDAKRCFASTPRGSLGLFRMREQVEMMGGKLFIDSGAGKGTRLSIKLPILQRSSTS
jgi:two-component system sensor histidine kinase DegS